MLLSDAELYLTTKKSLSRHIRAIKTVIECNSYAYKDTKKENLSAPSYPIHLLMLLDSKARNDNTAGSEYFT